MTDSVNMSLDDIIKQNRTNKSRGRGGGTIRGRDGGGRGSRRGRGRGGGPMRPGTPAARRGRTRGRSQSQSRGRGRSLSQGRSQSRNRSLSRNRSRSRQQRRSIPRARSASRSRSGLRGLTPKGRAGLEDQQTDMPQLVRRNSFNRGRGRGGIQNRLRRTNSNSNLPTGVHSRLGINTRSGGFNNNYRPLAVAKRGISKRGRGFTTRNRYSNVGLRSDQIIKQQRQNLMVNNSVIKSQTFTRSRNNSFNSPSQLTVSVANDFAKKRRNSVGNGNYLNPQSLAQLNNQFGVYKARRGSGSVKSLGSNRSNRSNRSSRSNQSSTSNRSSGRGRGRGRGRGINRGVGRKFINKQILNPKLQKEIAAIQGKNIGTNSNESEAPSGVNFTPTPAATGQTLHQRFASP